MTGRRRRIAQHPVAWSLPVPWLSLALFLVACNPKTETYFAAPEVPAGSISGRVTLRGVTPLAGMTLSVLAMTTTTGANGMYSFHDLAPRTYVVNLLNVPAGLICVPDFKEGEVFDRQTTIIDFECTLSDFLVNTQFSYVNVATGVSYVCVLGEATEAALFANAPGVLPALTGATWAVSWAGPGVVGSAQRNGTFDANNRMFDRQQINRFGTYTATLTVTANGLMKQATGEVTVGAAQGTCSPP